MKYKQITLPVSRDGSRNLRAPARSTTQAFGYKGNTCIEYLVTGENGGQSSESGELLYQVFVEKTEQSYSTELGPGFPFLTQMQLYVNKNGDAYRSWKGKLVGNPVCNFYTGVVYKYVHPNSKQYS